MQTYPLRDILHPAAVLFIQKCNDIGISLNTNEIEAINFLTTSLIQTNLWSKFRAIYPFVGRSDKSNSINLKNPFRHTIRWFGGPFSHDKFGVTNTGNGFGNTHVAPSWFSDNNIHVAVYTGTNWNFANTTCPLICATSASNTSSYITSDNWIHAIYLRARAPTIQSINTTTGQIFYASGGAPIFTYSCGTARSSSVPFAGSDASDRFHSEVMGLIVGVNGRTCYVYGEKYGREVNVSNISFGEKINPTSNPDPIEGVRIQYSQFPFLLFSNQGFRSSATVGQGRANLRFASIGYSINTDENKIFYNIIEKFQEILDRSVGKIILGPVPVAYEEKQFPIAELGIKSLRKTVGRYMRTVKDFRKLDPEDSKRYNIDALSASLQIKSCIPIGARRVYLGDGTIPNVSILSMVEN